MGKVRAAFRALLYRFPVVIVDALVVSISQCTRSTECLPLTLASYLSQFSALRHEWRSPYGLGTIDGLSERLYLIL
jgi:hypothetical protein